jgi:hypothetical protein
MVLAVEKHRLGGRFRVNMRQRLSFAARSSHVTLGSFAPFTAFFKHHVAVAPSSQTLILKDIERRDAIRMLPP